MSKYFSDIPEITGVEIPNCGTAHCIAGAALSISQSKSPRTLAQMFAEGIHNSPRIAAATVLELSDYEEECRLFGTGYWPRKFATAYNHAKTPKTRARIASERIDHFIKTKGKE